MKHYFTKRIPDDLKASLLEVGFKELKFGSTYADAFDIAVHNGYWIEISKHWDFVREEYTPDYEWTIIHGRNDVATSDLYHDSWIEAADSALETLANIIK